MTWHDPARTATRHATGGMVCSVDHLASSAGVAMLRHGGSAADAAIAANAVLAVTAQHMCGLGGDLYALVYPGGGEPECLDAAGRSGSGADPERLRGAGHAVMPPHADIAAVTVPGCVDGWVALHERFGRLPLEALLGPAIALAEDGFPASPLLAVMIGFIAEVEGADDYTRATVEAGSPIRRPGLARTLRAIANDGRAGFYEGEFGHGLLRVGQGEFAPADLAERHAAWVDPIATTAWNHTVWGVPPSSQTYVTLLAAAIAEGLELGDPADGRWAHLTIEAARAAAHDRPALLHENLDVSPVLTASAVERRRAIISPDSMAAHATPAADGDTMYLCTADRDGMAVSLIQSNAAGFGAGITVPELGIFLHNRGIGFSLEPGHPAEYGPGKKPPHTLAPVLVTTPAGDLRAALGTMGGDGQPQTVLQMLARLLGGGQTAGQAVGSPRWTLGSRDGNGFATWVSPDDLLTHVEQEAPDAWRSHLASRGHDLGSPHTNYGHAHCIEVTRHGTWGGASDWRAEVGAALGI